MSYKLSRFIGSLFALVVVAPFALSAQSMDAPRFGDRMRVTTNEKVSVGRLTSLDTAAIILHQKPLTAAGVLTNAASTTIPMASVQKLEVSRGRGARSGRTIGGAAIGLLSGALVAGTVGAMATQCTNCDGDSGIGVLMAVPGGILGLFIGGAIGFSHPADHWQSVSIPRSGLR